MSQLKHGGNTATFTSKRRQVRANELEDGREQRKHRKQQALDNPHNQKLRRDPGVPNLSVLHGALERRAVAMDQERKFQRSQAYAARRLADAERRAAKQRDGVPLTSETGGKAKTEALSRDVHNDAKDVAQRRHYWAEMVKVVDASDIILEVLDARDPDGCRCREVEKMIQSKMDRSGASPKRIILVMNKIDLVSHDNLLGWVKHLRREFPTIAFKSNTQQQSNNLKQTSHVSKGAQSDEATLLRSASVGSQALLQLLKNYSRSLNIKKQITVGIIGYPNVGKSSLINSLTRARRAAVGNMPGLTRSLQTVKLDHQISLIDSPGVMFSAGRKEDGSDDANMVLRNCLRFEQLADPVGAAWQVVARCTMQQLQEAYGLEGTKFEDAEQFLFLVAQKRGKLLRGGVPDVEGAAKIVLKDWNDGRIAYCSDPPVDVAASDLRGEAEVLSKWSQEFDVEKLLNAPEVELDEEGAELLAEKQRLQDELASQPLGSRALHDDHEAQAAAASAAAAEPRVIVPRPKAATESEEMDADDMDESTVAAASAASASAAAAAAAASRKVTAANKFNPQHNQQVKRALAEQKRRERKQANRAAGAADVDEDDGMAAEDEEFGEEVGEEDEEEEDAPAAAAAGGARYNRDLADMDGDL